MALKTLMLKQRLDAARSEANAAEAALQAVLAREAEIEASVRAADATNAEQWAAIEASVAAYDEDRAAAENALHEKRDAVAALEEELRAAEEKANSLSAAPDGGGPVVRQRGGGVMPNSQTRAMYNGTGRNAVERVFGGLSAQERAAIMQRDDVKTWLAETRGVMMNKRAIGNVGLTIPLVMMGLIRASIYGYSKLMRHVRLRTIPGDGMQLISSIPAEAIWTDCCATLNEMTMTFYMEEFHCWKVGGYYVVCNANLEDSDIDLAAEIVTALAEGIGLALDKAILYGRNASTTLKMPMGIMSRLVQTAQPDGYPDTARPWVDLHTSHLISVASSVHGVDLFRAIVTASGKARSRYANGEKTWLMNETTYTKLLGEAMNYNSGGVIVSGMGKAMPVIGGAVETLEFMPDDTIIGGYFDLYTLVERAGNKFAQSEHVRFIQDETVFKGTARYDGGPSVAEAFVAINIAGSTPNATMTFATDTANAAADDSGGGSNSGGGSDAGGGGGT